MKRINQRGSTEAVIMIGLAIALVFALGWIFYQNFIFDDGTKKDSDQSMVDEDNSSKHDSSNMLELSEFGMMVPLNEKTSDVTASFEDGVYRIVSASLAAKCGGEHTGGFGSVSRLDPSDDGTAPSSAVANAKARVTVDDVEYLFNPPQNACGDPTTESGNEANVLGEDLTDEFAKLFEKAHQL